MTLVTQDYFLSGPFRGVPTYNDEGGFGVSVTRVPQENRLRGLQKGMRLLNEQAKQGEGPLFEAFVKKNNPDVGATLLNKISLTNQELIDASTPHWLVGLAISVWNLFAGCLGFQRWEVPDYRAVEPRQILTINNTIQDISKRWRGLKATGEDLLAGFGHADKFYLTKSADASSTLITSFPKMDEITLQVGKPEQIRVDDDVYEVCLEGSQGAPEIVVKELLNVEKHPTLKAAKERGPVVDLLEEVGLKERLFAYPRAKGGVTFYAPKESGVIPLKWEPEYHEYWNDSVRIEDHNRSAGTFYRSTYPTHGSPLFIHVDGVKYRVTITAPTEDEKMKVSVVRED